MRPMGDKMLTYVVAGVEVRPLSGLEQCALYMNLLDSGGPKDAKERAMSEGPWEAGAIGRIPDDNSLVYRGDAVTGVQFYARTPDDAAQAARSLNELESDRAFLIETLRRARCRCESVDCVKHGAYASDDIARADKLLGEAMVPNPNQSPIHCIACGSQLVLRMWDRPGGPPSNGYVCPMCHSDR
jgi:hypothetical protein